MLTFQVADMSCGHCAGAITQAIKETSPEATVNIDLGAHTVSVEGVADAVQIQQAISAAGYTPVKQG